MCRDLLLVCLLFCVISCSAADLDVFFATEQGWLCIPAELADEPQTRSRGLSLKKTLPEDTAMLFWYPEPRSLVMWMKDTYVSLDMIFIDTQFHVAKIAEHTEPLSLRGISYKPGRAVLELVAGRAQQLGIKVGQPVHLDLPGAPPPVPDARHLCRRQSH